LLCTHINIIGKKISPKLVPASHCCCIIKLEQKTFKVGKWFFCQSVPETVSFVKPVTSFQQFLNSSWHKTEWNDSFSWWNLFVCNYRENIFVKLVKLWVTFQRQFNSDLLQSWRQKGREKEILVKKSHILVSHSPYQQVLLRLDWNVRFMLN